jgi:CelD/BcsL family acetyltransferase involved in cellulose biosynthesis
MTEALASPTPLIAPQENAAEAPPSRITITRGAEELNRLRLEWQALWRDCSEATEAQSWAWQNFYWACIARGRECVIATARNDRGELLAGAVFEIRRDRRSLLKVLSFSGEHDADYHLILHRQNVPVSVGVDLLLAVFRDIGREVSFVELSNMPKQSWTAEAFRAALPRSSFATTVQLRETETYAIALPQSIDDYWATFSKKTRDRLKGKQRKFEREMQPEFRVAIDARNVPAILDDIEAVDRLRWGAATKFNDPAQRGFLRELINDALASGMARVFTLHAGGKCVAFNVGFLCGDSLKVPYLANDITLPGNYSVGLINNVLAIEHCIQNGVREYDLTRGSEGYKSLLGGEPRHNLQCVAYRSRAHAALAAFNRQCVSPLVRNTFTRRLRQMLGR